MGRYTTIYQWKQCCKSKFWQYFRSDTKLATHAVPHGAPPEIANSSSVMERGAADDCIAGLQKSTSNDRRQPLPASPASAQYNNLATDDADESTQLLSES